MRRLLSRTSITIDEAVSILLGLSTGPIEFEPIFDAEDAEANCPTFSLRETLEDELEVLDGAYKLAKHEKKPAHIIAEKFAALKHQEAKIRQANSFLCAINDEINKGEQSMLKVDRVLSNAGYTYITLHSLDEWLHHGGSHGWLGELTRVAEPAGSQSERNEDSTTPKVRNRRREQEEAILVEIRKQNVDPTSLPKNPPGKPGVKAAVRAALMESTLFDGDTVFDKAWERLRTNRRIADAV